MTKNTTWRRRFALNATAVLTAALIAMVSQGAAAQSGYYAGKTVRIVVGSSAGGGYDTYARAIAPFLASTCPASRPSSCRTCRAAAA